MSKIWRVKESALCFKSKEQEFNFPNWARIEIPHQALGSADHSIVECLGRDLVQGNDGVPPLQLSLLQQFFTSYLSRNKNHISYSINTVPLAC